VPTARRGGRPLELARLAPDRLGTPESWSRGGAGHYPFSTTNSIDPNEAAAPQALVEG